MATAPHSSGAARGLFLTRLLVCVMLVVGVLVLLAPLCGDGMSLAMPATSAGSPHYAAAMAHGAQPMTAERGSSCDTPFTASPVRWWCSPDAGCAAFAVGVTDAPPPSDAVLLACMAVLVAILGAALGLRRPWPPQTNPPTTTVGLGAFVRLSRRPVLVELCVSRT
ncbi:MAG: hypothetical protein ABR608_08650 [Pseudonocardiaceae bacterium]